MSSSRRHQPPAVQHSRRVSLSVKAIMVCVASCGNFTRRNQCRLECWLCNQHSDLLPRRGSGPNAGLQAVLVKKKTTGQRSGSHGERKSKTTNKPAFPLDPCPSLGYECRSGNLHSTYKPAFKAAVLSIGKTRRRVHPATPRRSQH